MTTDCTQHLLLQEEITEGRIHWIQTYQHHCKLQHSLQHSDRDQTSKESTPTTLIYEPMLKLQHEPYSALDNKNLLVALLRAHTQAQD